MDNYIKKLKTIKENQDGFSLIELVVAVGILAILSVVGVVAYSKITENARQTAVEAAAAEVYKGAVAYDANGQDYKQAAVEWTNSAGNSSIEITMGDKNSAGEFCVKAVNKDHPGANASKGAGCGNSGTPETPGEGDGTTPPVIEETFVSVPLIDIVYSDGYGVPYADIDISGTLPAGTEITVQTNQYLPFEEWEPNSYNVNNLEVVYDNSGVANGRYVNDVSYRVASNGYASFGYDMGIEYDGAVVFVEVKLPDGKEFADGTTSVVYNQRPEQRVEEW